MHPPPPRTLVLLVRTQRHFTGQILHHHSGLAVTFVTLVTLILFWLIDWLTHARWFDLHRACIMHGSIENTQRRHYWVSLKHDRTSGTERWPFWHKGWQTGWRKHDRTNILKSELWRLTLSRISDPNRPTRRGIIWKLALTGTPDTIRPTRWTIINQHATAQRLWRHTTAPLCRCAPLHVLYGPHNALCRQCNPLVSSRG